ncbi:MAG: ATP-binding protein [Acidobacteria bacterium]|nr:ATP-binding protein [Acidobacteriota bacterium]
MKTEVVKPLLGNFISSLRDVGYTFEIAVADVLDNSIAARAKNVKILALAEPQPSFAMLDDGNGMSEEELVEAMRLATRNPDEKRAKDDLGRFGLGLKTASFSQCQKLTVVTKKGDKISVRQWDLKLLADKNEWLLVTPSKSEIRELPLFVDFEESAQGTLVVWEGLDRYHKATFVHEIDKLRRHLALVFHRFLEGIAPTKRLKISVNNNEIKAFNPFNPDHKATQQLAEETIKVRGSKIVVQPFVLPHHSKLSQQEYERYATAEGYTKSQGFYLYRANRLLIYGTWWGLHRAVDAHKLARIKIDISNDQDRLWGIDIKKSTASPIPEIRGDLSRIISQVTEKGSRTYSGRGKKIDEKNIIRFWQRLSTPDGRVRFALNKDHPLFRELEVAQDDRTLLETYMAGIQAYLPLEAIQAQLQQSPHDLDQEAVFTNEEIEILAHRLRNSSLDERYIEEFLKTELFKSRKELLTKNA